MKRSGMPPRKVPLARTGRLAPRSAKMRDVYERKGGRRDLVARLLRERPLCEAGVAWGRVKRRAVEGERWEGCTVQAVDVHELLARSAGGDILDETNTVTLCRACHSAIGRFPILALELGLRRSRYEGRNVDAAAVPRDEGSAETVKE